ncbi:MAG: LLM class flavin-dependent oxidoreductase [Variovorax sp.]|nr:MAG: LLM class flavin-dependent oxidoreductase [Variovorax sp.]
MPTTPARSGLALFEVPPVTGDAGAGYAVLLDNAVRAESLGYETYWLAEGRFSNIGLPSALTLLAALAQRTERLRLGTAVIPLAFDHPQRLAETAAVVNTLSGDRLELGVGKGNGGGFSAAAYNAYGLDEGRREELYLEALDRLRDAFEVQRVVDGTTFDFYPPAGNLPQRLWQATSKVGTARSIGRAGDGLQLHRFAQGGPTGDVQKILIHAYAGELPAGCTPRIGVSRSVLPAQSKKEAVRLFAAHLERDPGALPWHTPGASAAEILRDFYILHGTPDEIAAELADDAAATAATDYLFSVPLGLADQHYRESLAVIADEIHPALPGAPQVVPSGGSAAAPPVAVG